jgi:hypothetical protein
MAEQKAEQAQGKKILVINHTGTVYRIPINTKEGKGMGERISAVAHVVLLPGANAVAEDLLELIVEYPTVQSLFKPKGKALEVIDAKIDATTLAGFKDEADTIDLVDKTVDADLLKSWQRTEKRKKVLDAIEEQLAAIDPRNDKAAKDAAEGSAQ